jgi:hypothetical protein
MPLQRVQHLERRLVDREDIADNPPLSRDRPRERPQVVQIRPRKNRRFDSMQERHDLRVVEAQDRGAAAARGPQSAVDEQKFVG